MYTFMLLTFNKLNTQVTPWGLGPPGFSPGGPNKLILKTGLKCKLYILYKYYISNNKLRLRPAAHWGYPLNGRGLVLHTSSPSSSLGNSNSPGRAYDAARPGTKYYCIRRRAAPRLNVPLYSI